MNRKFNEGHLFETEPFCNIINVLTVTFDQFDASSLNTIYRFFFFLAFILKYLE